VLLFSVKNLLVSPETPPCVLLSTLTVNWRSVLFSKHPWSHSKSTNRSQQQRREFWNEERAFSLLGFAQVFHAEASDSDWAWIGDRNQECGDHSSGVWLASFRLVNLYKQHAS